MSPTPNPTMSCRAFTTPEACPTSRCVVQHGFCTDFDWYTYSLNTDVSSPKSYKGVTSEEQGCANLCGAESEAFVWNSSLGSCWCAERTTEWVASAGVGYYRVGAGIFAGKVCRLNKSDRTLNGEGSVKVQHGKSYEQCMETCWADQACTGVEYSSQWSRCEIWSKPIRHMVDKKGFECRLVRQVEPCSVADRTTTSAAYPCACGLATCTKETNKCSSLESECE
eukprot:TRINITY_DN66352_c0_g1_i1.p1 TRINITY_DN66352_c0_g1~~TRINITY_DN66352_c0_g1_i1.p1  ORF type:complete len:224 (-),score=11.06 TRINITY_DN66352_c0_g1_i1:112-783(-)